MPPLRPVPIRTPHAASQDNLIPDCCNIGVIVRALLAVNLVVLGAVLSHSQQIKAGLLQFVESAMLLEWACLLSLFALCGVRQILLARNWHPPAWLQRLLCGIVPAVVVSLLVSALVSFDWFSTTFPHMNLAIAIGVAFAFGIALQHYFEVRARAFSPALVEARLQALQARIRPHFLFNSLNAVLSLIRSEPLRAETTLEDLAELFRVLMRDAREQTTLGDEIRLCRQYLSIEKIRLGERLQVKWDMTNTTDALLRKAQIPSLLLQPLLENAVHYGVEPSGKPCLVKIRISRSIDRIEIVIQNPVDPTVVVESGNQMALGNIRERLALLYDVEAQLTHGVIGAEYEVRLRFPYVRMLDHHAPSEQPPAQDKSGKIK